MTTGESGQTPEILKLESETGMTLGRYATALAEFRQAEAQLQVANDFIERVNQGLPEGFKVGTHTSFFPIEQFGVEHTTGYNKVYRPNEAGDYVVAGEVCTEGSKQTFLGDRILRTDEDELIVINTELQIGLSVKDKIFLVNTATDSPELRSFERKLLPKLQDMTFGATINPDFSYL